jgi:hypothetical protein
MAASRLSIGRSCSAAVAVSAARAAWRSARTCVPIPAALRHRCRLLPGDPILLTAVPAEDTLTAYSLAMVDQALAAHIPFPAREGGDR